VTDPAPSTPPTTNAALEAPVPGPALRLLTSDDDLACVDDLCLPGGVRDRLDAVDDDAPVDGMDPAR
jgi:hypothetical protein